MSEQVLVGCSGWNYGDTPDKGGWTKEDGPVYFIQTKILKD